MKIKHILTASILALSTASLTQAAEIVLHVTGSTAFRGAFVQSVEDQMNAAGAYSVAYEGAAGNPVFGAELGAGDSVLRGTINGQAVTVKCTWTGSIGGVIAVSKQVPIQDIPVTTANADGWLSITNLGTQNGHTALVTGNQTLQNSANATTPNSVALDTGTFSTETQLADVCMSDSFQSSSGFFTKPALGPASTVAGEIIGVVPFEWVTNNGAQASLQSTVTASTMAGSTTATLLSTAGLNISAGISIAGAGAAGAALQAHVVSITDGTHVVLDIAATAAVSGVSSTVYFANQITSLNANQAQGLLQGGLVLSQLTGNPNDQATFVYAMGRNFDSGTRLAALNESGLGTTSNIQQMVPDGGSTSGVTGAVLHFDQTPTATLYAAAGFPHTFTTGNDGFPSGGTLAGWVQAPGSFGATPSGAVGSTAPAFDGAGNEGGWFISYLSRGDADTAVGSFPNTSHRLLWNGAQDWPASTGAAAVIPATGYVDSNVEQGAYTFWEYEHFLGKAGLPAAAVTVANGIAEQLTGAGAAFVPTAAHPNGDAVVSGILSPLMMVSKTVEGGVIDYSGNFTPGQL